MDSQTYGVKPVFDRLFLRQYKKAGVRIRNEFDKRLRTFVKNPNYSPLNNHALRDEWLGHRSIDVTADWRAIYKEMQIRGRTVAYFVTIGTHKQLYK